jgi:hypothetical protein
MESQAIALNTDSILAPLNASNNEQPLNKPPIIPAIIHI